MEIGALVYQQDTDRMDIRFSPNRYYGGLRCGDTFDVRINRKWIPTRIELGRTWFLVGIKTDDLVGLDPLILWTIPFCIPGRLCANCIHGTNAPKRQLHLWNAYL